jgi:hypothetical protein
LLRDREVELQDQGRQVRSGKPEQPAHRGETKLVEPLEPFLQRIGGKLTPLRRQ